ncbi:hypothetical protein GCM10023169_40410 [Georgenia halophila]|uniref:Uncharacterized protein n=1 Tax=Georgenia halophila TaxID=620889 RepID=A0ABP8LP90_9MICO
MSDLLRGEQVPPRPPLYFFSHWHLNAVRGGRWKAHVDRFPNPGLRELPQLFDVQADTEESYNLDDLYPDVLERMLGLVDDFSREIKSQRQDAEARARS